MIEIHRVLCPIDFSDASRHALAHAVAIASWYGSEVTALHVVPGPLVPQPPILGAAFADGASVGVPDRTAREDTLRAWLEPARRAGVKADVLVDEGNAAGRILEHARLRAADLIVMGTHGLSGFERMMLGSVAEKVLFKAACPVMTVPPAAVTEAKIPYTRLLCPVDFSESSMAAFRLACSLAKEANASLTILHIFEWPSPEEELLVERFDAPEFRRVLEEEPHRRLDALLTDDITTWCQPSTKVAYGKPYRQILDVATDERTDLVVIGVSGRNPLDRMLFGSTTSHVVRRASCPVLTMRRPT